ncbi:Alpha-N-acetylglucosaminidase (N-acetyl-alpha-glucosaminidase) (NAG) [Cleaved into: Alpha-N-acetylglucosaminidase 82 kDa form [Durusdinium trenchii]|uniref:Alpha-N-acetylglucosaminidase (N-acetyl-alpha-glucosaminidase) (NAG) [Cleaved into: Alpha-N-acetylglucosaminidase 82 kDa form n=1 Tax=Durusdinium trenchii TaxID=1381693 RepID=A0ABP0PX47_9DINO
MTTGQAAAPGAAHKRSGVESATAPPNNQRSGARLAPALLLSLTLLLLLGPNLFTLADVSFSGSVSVQRWRLDNRPLGLQEPQTGASSVRTDFCVNFECEGSSCDYSDGSRVFLFWTGDSALPRMYEIALFQMVRVYGESLVIISSSLKETKSWYPQVWGAGIEGMIKGLARDKMIGHSLAVWEDVVRKMKRAGSFKPAHMADLLRLAVLYLCGGMYSDFDALWIRQVTLEQRLGSMLVRSKTGLSNGAIAMRRHSILMRKTLIAIPQVYNPGSWNSIGSPLIVRVLSRCGKPCEPGTYIKYEQMYTIPWTASKYNFDDPSSGQNKELRGKILRNETYQLHLFGSHTRACEGNYAGEDFLKRASRVIVTWTWTRARVAAAVTLLVLSVVLSGRGAPKLEERKGELGRTSSCTAAGDFGQDRERHWVQGLEAAPQQTERLSEQLSAVACVLERVLGGEVSRWFVLKDLPRKDGDSGDAFRLQRVETSQGLALQVQGPAFLGWFRMGNLADDWAGPLSDEYKASRGALAKKILARMRSLGMTPILPAFSGHVPCSIGKVFPGADLTKMPWQGFRATCFLDPITSKDVFLKLGRKLLQTHINIFGSDHVYTADQFNEMGPRDGSTAYLSACSAAVFQAMRDVDPHAVWVMQGWFLASLSGCEKTGSCEKGFWNSSRRRAYFGGVPSGGLVVLDLDSDERPLFKSTESFSGHSFILSIVHAFGGKSGIHGNLTGLALRSSTAKDYASGLFMGPGLAPESIENDPIVFELQTEQRWGIPGTFGLDKEAHPDQTKFPLRDYLKNWAKSRYGDAVNQALVSAWMSLGHPSHGGYSSSFQTPECGASVSFPFAYRGCCPSGCNNDIVLQPFQSLTPRSPNGRVHGKVGAANSTHMLQSLRLLVEGAQQLRRDASVRAPATLVWDVVDVGREVMDHLFWDLCRMWDLAVSMGNLEDASAARNRLLAHLRTMDDLLKTSPDFLLGRWLKLARDLAGSNASQQDLFEYNARNQVTLWGPDNNHHLNDYSPCQWSGMIWGFYSQRWGQAMNDTVDALSEGRAADLERSRAKVEAFERRWQRSFASRPHVTQEGDAILQAASFLCSLKMHRYDKMIPATTMIPSARLLPQRAWNVDPDVLSTLCESSSHCAGFSTDGWLFSSVAPSGRIAAPELLLFLKGT